MKNNNQKMKCFFLILVSFLFAFCGSSPEVEIEEPQNYKPVAIDDLLTVDENSVAGTSNQITVSTNDKIGNDGGDNDNYAITNTATNGVVTEISDGVFEYVPETDFFGEDSFEYKISDKDGDAASATVTITVTKFVPAKALFNNIDPNLPSFVSIEDTTPATKKWVKLASMSDEFDSWDGSKWFKSTWNYGVPVFMSKSVENSGVIDGKLWIKATLNENNADGRWFQAARIHSKAETSYPMYTEASIITAHISAYNTYWLNKGEGGGGIFRDEIDIIENNSKPSCTNCEANVFPGQMNSQYFHADNNKTPKEIRNKSNFLRSNLSSTNPKREINWNEDYHTFGVWWKDKRNIQFYLDGEPAGSVVVGEHKDGTYFEDRFFTRELEIIFDLWTNEAGWLGGLPDKTDLNDNSINTMRIDWVRTWKLEDK